MTRPPVRCIFCGYSGPLTDEHIYSRGVHRFLPPGRMRKYRKLTTTVYPDFAEFRYVKRAGDMRDWQVRCVCEKHCNNGWMRRRIENPARPLLRKLIQGQDIRLHAEQQKIIAAWAVLKAMVAEYDREGYVTTHHTHRKFLMKYHRPPFDTWTVWIGHFVRDKWQPYFASIPFLFLSAKQEARRTNERATYYNSGISTQVIGQLFIQVIRSPARDFIKRWRFATPDKGTLIRIWPPAPFSVAWPPRTMTDRDADYAVGALKTFLEDRAYAVRQRRLNLI
jgi:hypothetical protein